MATAAAIAAQITEAQQLLERRREEMRLAEEEAKAADKRQRLRRELDRLNTLVDGLDESIANERRYRREVDNDTNGRPPLPRSPRSPAIVWEPTTVYNHQTVNCKRDAVFSGEMEWEIVGMSWLRSTLKQCGQDAAKSKVIEVGEEQFGLLFDPDRRLVHKRNDKAWKSSLSVRHYSDDPITFRHAFFIKRADGAFVQWGESDEECQTTDTEITGVMVPIA